MQEERALIKELLENRTRSQAKRTHTHTLSLSLTHSHSHTQEERALFKELLENSDSLAGYVHEAIFCVLCYVFSEKFCLQRPLIYTFTPLCSWKLKWTSYELSYEHTPFFIYIYLYTFTPLCSWKLRWTSYELSYEHTPFFIYIYLYIFIPQCSWTLKWTSYEHSYEHTPLYIYILTYLYTAVFMNTQMNVTRIIIWTHTSCFHLKSCLYGASWCTSMRCAR